MLELPTGDEALEHEGCVDDFDLDDVNQVSTRYAR